jgi:putative nucleotidyltransferase with HDIG domain
VRLRELAVGGLLHDVGKLAVPNEILQKPGALTDEEFDAIKRHPELGSELVRELGFSAQVARLVLDHHERLDGTGYPRGLGAPDLDIETRILAVCDVFDALLSKRVYRDAWRLDDALELISRESGTKFDPACVDALERVIGREQDRVSRVAA